MAMATIVDGDMLPRQPFVELTATPVTRNPKYNPPVSDFLIIEFRTPASTTWDASLGRYTATKEEIAELRALLAGRENPYDVLDQFPKGLLFDTIESIKELGYEARIRFPN
jgi:hypothetical protein